MLKSIGAIILFGWTLAWAQNGELIIVYTNNTNGVLENCNCPERSYGGLEKRAALIDSLRRTNPDLLLVDSGDLLDIRPNALLHSYIIKSCQSIGYDAWTPGDQDFIEGIGFFRQQLTAMPGRLVSANLSIDDQLTGSRWSLIERGGVSIGITGITHPRTLRYLPDSTTRRLSVDDIASTLESILPEISAGADLIILLSHAGFDIDTAIAARFPVIDIIVGGHSQTVLESPEIIGSTMVVQAGEGGNRVGILRLEFVNGEISSYHNGLQLLKISDRNDPKVMELISEYHKKRLITIHSYQ